MKRQSPIRVSLPSIGWGTHLFVASSSLFFLLWLIPFYDGLPGAHGSLDPPNEKTRVLGMVSIGLYGEFHINRARKLFWTRQIDLAGRKRNKSDPKGSPRLLLFPAKTPGMHMGLGALYWAYRKINKDPPSLWEATYFARLFGCILPVWLTSMLFYLLLLNICRSRYVILTGYFVFLLGNMTYPYALVVASHSLANGLLLLAFAALWWCPRSGWLRFASAAAAGLAIGMAFGAEYSSLFSSIWLGAFSLIVTPPTPARYLARPLPKGWRYGFLWLFMRWHLLVALGASLLPVAAVLHFHKVAFGAYTKTPYAFMLNPSFRHSFSKVNFLIFTLPPKWEQSFAAIFAPSYGLLFWTPFLAFAIVGLYRLWKRRMWGILLIFLAFGAFWFSYPSMQYNPRGGWSVGPRYIANLVPFAMLLAVWGADLMYSRYGNRVVPLIALSGVWSILHYAPISVHFPHPPTSFSWPQLEVVGAMMRNGLAPSSISSLSPWWYMHLYFGALASLCAYLLLSGFRNKRWPGMLLTTLSFCLIFLAATQLPSINYESADEFINYVRRFVPDHVRW